MSSPVFINAVGKFLPGEPITNDEVEEYIGLIGGEASRLKSRILKQNGIQKRHYAINREGKLLFWNSTLAARSIIDAISHSEITLADVEYLAAATSQGDLLAPGFASMVQGELRLPPCEVASFHGVCASGIMALKSCYAGIRSGEHRRAVACASELTSRFFRPGFFEITRSFKERGRIPFDAEFLRWMLSDGAGAAVLEGRPNERSLSLRVDWIDLVSYADRFDVCMYAGATKNSETGKVVRSWYDYSSVAEAASDGAVLLKQDLGLLDNIVLLGVGRYFELIEAGKFSPSEVDWMVCHYSSHHFRGKIFDLLQKGGGMIPEDRWFTNLYTKGNTGSASIFIMLEELINEGRLRPGQKILCMVPESGRFIVSFMHLTVVDGTGPPQIQPAPASESRAQSALPTAPAESAPSDLRARLTRQLTQVWIDFETRLHQIPIIEKLERGQLRIEDYRLLLLNLRQQVVEGGRWIARAASNITADAFDYRSMFIEHAFDEHRDFRMIEKDFVSVGGDIADITSAEKNIGTEALSAWMFHRAGQENPFDLLGAMFIIEGLGMRVANRWGEKIRRQLGLNENQVSFLLYHGANDVNHFDRFEKVVGSGVLTEELVTRIVKTAKVTARLYLLQLEELGNT
ncbi:MAG TPA: 3-oxoacyl-[acyl-carrier-protein] synthase III C-terminal domain-containing protein [Pyrinomonadaceae bacterium]|nr:3-oxoacyl-[acyl-carrier-protein] synthase III C-terminal domain-containing protein [Pyrinomonadaceae bacterium]